MNWLLSELGNISKWMNQYKFTHYLYVLLRYTGLIYLGHTLFGLWFHCHPTEQMLNDKKFFREHKQELKEVFDMLEDEKSKSVFENILKFRVTSQFKYVRKAMGADSPETQYFVPEIQFSDHEVVIDCGAYIGDTVKKLYARFPGEGSVIALEPDEKNYEQLSKLKFNHMTTYKCGAWSENTILRFSNQGGGTVAGSITEDGNITIEVKALDCLPECCDATYIKMDIEGAELEALKGAENIIKNKRPKLAICIYHKPEDLFEIPQYIKKLNPDYRFFIHHHTWCKWDTVLYAI